ncbi:unnamed protein product [Ambrosiozyma monospora]|uniref:Unnamed protein product n=1 Tax=Ambrosiozyma monospora TaxID=43982 RepID=A0ACB5U0A6_AMBMO|nr:unnamed protein product [Ambrosiozyma monospora]
MASAEIEKLETTLKNLTIQSILSHPTKSRTEIAMEFFQMGTIKEAQGLLNDAIDFYRKAFKLDEKIDLKYRELLRSNGLLAGQTTSNQTQTQNSTQGHRRTTSSGGTGTTDSVNEKAAGGSGGEMVLPGHNFKLLTLGTQIVSHHDTEHFKKLALDKKILNSIHVPSLLASCRDHSINKLNENQPESIFAKLPNEIISKIMDLLIVKDTPSWFNLSLTCRKLAYLGFHETTSWRSLCHLVYPKQHYNRQELELNSMLDPETGTRDENRIADLVEVVLSFQMLGIYHSESSHIIDTCVFTLMEQV